MWFKKTHRNYHIKGSADPVTKQVLKFVSKHTQRIQKTVVGYSIAMKAAIWTSILF